MDIWDAVKRPPKDALKKITGGRLKGMSDISPQWRMQAMTEMFGPCGTGWKYEIVDQKTADGPDGQVAAFVQINLYYKRDGWSDPIPGVGGSMLVSQERNGVYVNDEAFKMALTDALSVAMKALGVAADIYAGKWDGSKYADDAPAPVVVPNDDADVARIRSAKTIQELRDISSDINQGLSHDDPRRDALRTAYQERRDELGQ